MDLASSRETLSSRRAPLAITMSSDDIGIKELNCHEDSACMADNTSEHNDSNSPEEDRPTDCLQGFRRIPEILEHYHKLSRRVVQDELGDGCQKPIKRIASFFPILKILTRYRWRWVVKDLHSGIVVSMTHLPQAMAGGMTAVMKPQHGLFMTIFPALAYVLFGTSPQNSVGGMPITAALVGVSMARIREEYHPDNFTSQSAEVMLDLHFGIAGVITFVAGLTQICMSFLKLGFLSKLMSSNVMDPFSVACCLQAICGQIPVMLGIKLFPYCGLAKHPWLVFSMMSNIHAVNGADALISALTASTILGFREFVQPILFRKTKLIIPIEFFILVLATAVSYYFNLTERYGLRIMGKVPASFPAPTLPSMEYIPHALVEGFISGVVSFTLTLNSAKILARKDSDRISTNQELFAVGASNLFGSFFSCFVAASPIGRSVINQSLGSKSQLSSLFGCSFMAICFFLWGQSLTYLPVCVISTNIVVTLVMTLQIFADLPVIWKGSKLDAIIWVSTFTSCIVLDVRIGLITGVILTLFSVVYRTQKPKLKLLGRIKDSSGYVPLKYYPQAEEVPGVKIIQMQTALHYANAEYLIKQAKRLTFQTGVAPVYALTRVSIAQEVITEDRRQRSVSLPEKIIEARSHNGAAGRVRFSEVNSVASSRGSIELTSSADIPKSNIVYGVVLDLTMSLFIDSVGFRALEQLADDLKNVDVGLFIVQYKGNILDEIKKQHILRVISERSIFWSLEDAVAEAVRRGSRLLSTDNKKRRLSRVTDTRFWPMDSMRVEGLPTNNND